MSELEITVVERERAELRPLRADQPKPGDALGDDEVEGHTLCSLVSPGTELAYAFTGKSYPAYPGYAAVFVVERKGGAVRDLANGDIVFSMGNHRSFQRHSARRVVRVPEGLDPAIAVFTRLLAISMTTLVTTKARPPARVAVMGLGPIGNLAAQIFHASGYRVSACDPVEGRRALLTGRGIDVLPALADVDDLELAVDCSGHEAAVLDACKRVRRGGEVVLVGVPWAPRTELSAHALLHAVFHHYVVLRSGWEWELPMDATEFRPGDMMQNLAAGLQWLREKRVSAEGLASPAAPEDAQRVYSDLLGQRGGTLTTVFDWRKSHA
jgi:threonine dehydrogenase-like Zn-dependent dehydrogenase